MVLEILKNNFERKGENYYNKKIHNSTSKYKKKKKRNYLLEEDSEKDSRNIESGINEESYNVYELYENLSNKNKKNMDSSFLKLNKNGSITKNKIRELYKNSKENLHYGTNENDIFTEDIYENDNFDDDNFVEDENIEYKTYNSYANPESKLFNNYSNTNIKKVTNHVKRSNKHENILFNKYNYDAIYDKKNINKFDSNIIRILNNKKNVEYEKQNDNYSRKNMSYNYNEDIKYNQENYKNYNDNEEENNNYEYEDDRDENYYDYEDDNEDEDEDEDDDDDNDNADDNYEDEDDKDVNENGDNVDNIRKNELKVNKIKENKENEEYEKDEFEENDEDNEEDEELEEEYDDEEEEEEEEEDENEEEEEEEEDDENEEEEEEEEEDEDENEEDENEDEEEEEENRDNYDIEEEKYYNTLRNKEDEEKEFIKNYNNINKNKEEYQSSRTRVDEYFEKKIIPHKRKENESLVPCNILNDQIDNKNYEFKVMNYEKEYKEDNFKNKEKKNHESLKILISENNNKDDLTKHAISNMKKIDISNKTKNDILIFENSKFNYNKKNYPNMNKNDKIIKNNNSDNAIYEKLNCRQKEIINNIENIGSLLNESALEDNSNPIFYKKNNGFKEFRFNGEIIQEINVEDKKKNNIKNFLYKMKNKKNSDDVSKKEDKKYEFLQKKDKLKIKFTDILYAGTLGQFFHRSKNNFVNCSSPQFKGDNTFEPSNNLNNLDKFNFNDYKTSITKDTYAENIALKSKKDNEKENNNKREMETKLDNNFNEKTNVEQHICCNLVNDMYDKIKDDKKYNELSNKQEKVNFMKLSNALNDDINVKKSDKYLDKNKNLYLDDHYSSKHSYINDSNERKCDVLKNPNSVRNMITNRDYYKNRYDKNLHAKNEKINVTEDKGTIYTHSYSNSYRSENKTESLQNTIKKEENKKPKIRSKEKKIEDKKQKELEVKIDETLSRKMIENNELKNHDEIDEDYIVTPFYIKSKIDKVLKNSEIFERSARATFQQFDIKNKNFLHFSEIESLIQKLCYNLELPPVDKNILSIVYKDYDSSKNNSMNYTDFRQMYWDLLKQIKKKYYPTKNFKIKRNCIISRKKLGGYDYSSIYNYLSFKKILGCGAFGEVHLVEDNICKLYKVVKILKKKSMKNVKINEEINVLIYLDHPNIIKIFDVYENIDCTYIVMELCEGGELMNKIKNSEKFNEKYIKNIMFQILCAIAYMHSHNIAHKDLKPENILFKAKDDDTLKIIDFGLAELINKSEGVSKTAAGTVLYMAPEVFKKNFTIKCDIWSAGVIMFFLFSKNLPFCGNTYEEVKQSIFKDEPDYKSLKPKLSQSALHILKLMLEKDHNKRPMAAVLLHHPWFQGYLDPIEISPTTLNNIKSYMKHSNIRNIIINIMAHELSIINKHIKYINEIFCKIDTNHNGSLSHREIYTVLSSAGIKKWDINRIVQALDINDRGNITYTEFIAGCYRWKNIESTFLKAAFNKIDKVVNIYMNIDVNISLYRHKNIKSDIVTLVRDKDIDSNDIDNFFTSVYSIKKYTHKEKKINKISFEDFKEYMLSTF
ncbi:calcium-dependent protein kinase 6, putative [Plasmodium gallinaceum]|uniref:non-specific serine/threonine protein kinase n=1 Tax=Plasmodium gallinaceum TaxID=5849 RepID=A0A1J1GVE5_PLAGA|nr:calcium-dependent protein kinase 6, putative [Plasmodium gallinaceum]CRG96276.1 calcium-dependent protein kinase 6, putative [Plasmodium gallinaceum]